MIISFKAETDALWLVFDNSVGWVELTSLIITGVIGALTLYVLFLNVQEVRKSRHESTSPSIFIASADVVIDICSKPKNKTFSLQLGRLGDGSKGKRPRLLNLGSGVASNIVVSYKVKNKRVFSTISELEQFGLDLEFKKSSFGEPTYEKLTGTSLSQEVVGRDQADESFNYLIPEEKSESQLTLRRKGVYEEVCLNLWLSELRQEKNVAIRHRLKSENQLVISYYTQSGVEVREVFTPVLTLKTQIIETCYDPSDAIKYYGLLTFEKEL